jgi:hypothetical protein
VCGCVCERICQSERDGSIEFEKKKENKLYRMREVSEWRVVKEKESDKR